MTRERALPDPASDASGALVTRRTTGSTACAQQPQVTQVGGHVPSSSAACSRPLQGSRTASAERPDALMVRSDTMRARTSRRTRELYPQQFPAPGLTVRPPSPSASPASPAWSRDCHADCSRRSDIGCRASQGRERQRGSHGKNRRCKADFDGAWPRCASPLGHSWRVEGRLTGEYLEVCVERRRPCKVGRAAAFGQSPQLRLPLHFRLGGRVAVGRSSPGSPPVDSSPAGSPVSPADGLAAVEVQDGARRRRRHLDDDGRAVALEGTPPLIPLPLR